MDKPQRLARKQEQDRDGSYGGRLVPQSGSGVVKGDRRTDTEYIEYKHTERGSFSLKLTELMKAAREAILASKRMVFEVEFTNTRGMQPIRFVVLNKDEYIAMREIMAQADETIRQLSENL
jgi:hypothetical protein